MKSVILLFTALCLTIGSNAFCTEAVNTTDSNNPFVKMLAAQELKYFEAGNNGDLEAWLSTRDAKNVAKIKNIPGLTGEMLKAGSKSNADLREFEFVRVETVGDTARTVYKKVTKDSVTIYVTMFHKEGGDWKIGEGTDSSYGGDLAKDIDGAIEKTLANPKLQLPKH